MKITPKPLVATADISSARGGQWAELARLLLWGAAVIAAVLLGIGLLADRLVALVSPATEATWFGPLLPDMGVTSDRLPQALRERGEAAVAVLERFRAHPDVPALPYRLRFLDEAEPNALALPGGLICVTEGLLRQVDGEIPLAFVLGHELGHYRNRDHLRALARALGISGTLALLFGGDPGGIVTRISGIAQLGYSRAQEERADRFGLLLVHDVLGDLSGATRLFEILSGTRALPAWAYMLGTHPAPERRIELLRRYAQTLGEAREPAGR